MMELFATEEMLAEALTCKGGPPSIIDTKVIVRFNYKHSTTFLKK